ncbi:NnrS family protein [Polycladidibacter stylochi]|uniref:NnrS family protein n=1 Tax=Polycladidibacter stylochi TaxID=1807766 RepID=UPI00082C26DF|nr:NnrS family protein [Pseudovibrio stylochi]
MQASSSPRLQATFSLGFRPFYLLGAIYAAITIPLWIFNLTGHLEISGPLDGLYWHAHELLFGFGAAILIGFLFTAVQNWTGVRTPHGTHLALLALLWLAGRIVLLFWNSPLASIIDLAFLPAATVGVAIPLIKANNRRNLFVIMLLSIMSCANLAFHADAWGWITISPEALFLAVIDIFAIFISVIAGRIIPIFTNNALGPKAVRLPKLEAALVIGMLALLVLDSIFGMYSEYPLPQATLCIALGVLHAFKLGLWSPFRTWKNPILWILPLSYAWLPLAFLLRAAALLEIVELEQIYALHALTIGAMAGMMLAMMTRSSLGHTGRPMRATWVDTLIFYSIMLSATARVFLPLISDALYTMSLHISATLWVIAFAAFALRYAPMLTTPRADGRPM